MRTKAKACERCKEVRMGKDDGVVRDFGVFEIRTRAPRVAFNPKTLERVFVPTRKTVKFKVGRLMKLGLESRTETACARPTLRRVSEAASHERRAGYERRSLYSLLFKRRT